MKVLLVDDHDPDSHAFTKMKESIELALAELGGDATDLVPVNTSTKAFDSGVAAVDAENVAEHILREMRNLMPERILVVIDLARLGSFLPRGGHKALCFGEIILEKIRDRLGGWSGAIGCGCPSVLFVIYTRYADQLFKIGGGSGPQGLGYVGLAEWLDLSRLLDVRRRPFEKLCGAETERKVFVIARASNTVDPRVPEMFLELMRGWFGVAKSQ